MSLLASALSSTCVTTSSLTSERLRPLRFSSRRMRYSPKSASMTQRSSPSVIVLRSARAPMTNAKAPRIILLPAPVSPVSTEKPFSKSMSKCEIRA